MKKIIFLAIFILLINSLTLATDVNKNFSDVKEEHWAYNDIINLVEKGTLSGYTDGTFKPDKSITRAEAAKILMTTFKNSAVFYSDNVANDVPNSHWANPYITNGDLYISVDENKNFRPDEYITRGDFASAVHKMIQYHLSSSSYLKNFSDVKEDNKNYGAIVSLAGRGIINGFEDNTFRPDEKLTRAQVCKIINVAYEYVIEKYTDEMKKEGGWATYQIEVYGIKKVREDNEGNLMIYTGGKSTPVDLYYNGEYVTTANGRITKVRKEELVTSDNKKWSVKWYGTDVVELIVGNKSWTVRDNYSGISKTYDEEYILFEDIINEMKYFSGLEFNVTKNNDSYFIGYKKDGFSFSTGINYIEKDGKLYGNVLDIKDCLWDLYMNSSVWQGVTKEVLENSKLNMDESKSALVIPDIPIESFASEAKAHNTMSAYKNQVGIVYKMGDINYKDGKLETITQPIYLRLRELYSGEEAEEIVRQYNEADSILKYNKQKEENKLYCILFDVDLKDFYGGNKEESSYTNAYFMLLPTIRVTDLKNSQIGTTTGQSIPREADKFWYYKGDLTQIYVVFETPKYVEAFAIEISFINENDYTYENFFISTNNK